MAWVRKAQAKKIPKAMKRIPLISLDRVFIFKVPSLDVRLLTLRAFAAGFLAEDCFADAAFLLVPFVLLPYPTQELFPVLESAFAPPLATSFLAVVLLPLVDFAIPFSLLSYGSDDNE